MKIGRPKIDLDFIKNKFLEEGYTVLSNLYKGSKDKIEFICSNDHIHSITWGNWQQGHRCSYCKKNTKLSLSIIAEHFSIEGFKLLSEVYNNSFTKLKYLCPKRHIHHISWADWSKGVRCAKCANIKISTERSGPASHFWMGGISNEQYCEEWLDKDYKESIKERDGYICLNPRCLKKDSVLSIHHINYNKKDCRPDNLITVCRSCNSSANFDRDWHETWYQAIIKRRNLK